MSLRLVGDTKFISQKSDDSILVGERPEIEPSGITHVELLACTIVVAGIRKPKITCTFLGVEENVMIDEHVVSIGL